MKSFFYSAVLLAAAAALPAQNTPPAPVPNGAGAVAGSAPPSSAAVPAAEPSAPVDPAVPEELKQYGVDRYEKIVEKSPFNFKIIKQASAPAISFAADLSLAGYTRDVGKGVEYATLVDKKKNTRFVINNQSPNKDGIQLVKLYDKKKLLESTVVARKGSEEHEIKAEKQIVERKSVVAASVMSRGGGQQPVQPGMPQGVPGQPGVPNPNVRNNNVQAQINNQLQPPVPGPTPPQVASNVGGGGNQPLAVQTQNPAPTVADQAMARQNPGGGRGEGRGDGQRGGDGQPQPNKRRVILPPPVVQ